jgi:hypothetical protein
MDISDTLAPNSEQVNAEDLLAGPRTVTISQVERGSSEQPVFIHLAEFPGRTYRPSKSMRRVLVAAWGSEASAYIGRRMTIFRNPEITFGREKVGGIQISALSNIPKALTVALTVSRGKRNGFTVQPLPDAAPAPTPADQLDKALNAIRNAPDATTLANIWAHVEKLGLQDETVLIDASNQRTEELRGDA